MDLSADGLQVLRIIADSDGDLATKESFGVPTNPMSLQVTVVVREGAKSVGGGPLIRGFCSTYLIGLTSANPPPRVISVNPTQNSIEVALVESIRVTFSEEVNPLSVIGVSNDPAFPINIRLRGQQQLPNMGGTVPVPVSLLQGTITQTFPGDNCRYTFTPMSPYPGQTIVSVHVVGASLLDPNIVPTPPTDPAPVTDMLGEQLVFTNTTQFRTAPGPIVANNPTPPYAIYFGALNPNRFGVIAINAVEDAQGSTVGLRTIDSDGDRVARNGEDLLVFPNSENSASIGRVAGIEVGNVITLTNIPVTDPGCYPSPPFPFPTFVTGNTMDNPPLPNPPPRPNINSTSNCAPSLCTFPPVIRPNANNSDLGNFVYVADDVNNVVHVINSTTSLPITQIPTPNPSGLQTDPDMNFLFVTNFSANTMSIIDIRRGSQTQHQVIREVPVGLGPKALTVQPDTEDILVCNQIGNSVHPHRSHSVGYHLDLPGFDGDLLRLHHQPGRGQRVRLRVGAVDTDLPRAGRCGDGDLRGAGGFLRHPHGNREQQEPAGGRYSGTGCSGMSVRVQRQPIPRRDPAHRVPAAAAAQLPESG
jgi:hypothetical protein